MKNLNFKMNHFYKNKVCLLCLENSEDFVNYYNNLFYDFKLDLWILQIKKTSLFFCKKQEIKWIRKKLESFKWSL